jgi:diguanylate cyclase (GGDEF)-like protein
MSRAPKSPGLLLEDSRNEPLAELEKLRGEMARMSEELARRTLERTQLQQTIHELTELSLRDPLTALYNRRGLSERLVEEWSRARRYGAPLSLMMVDIDHFKRINDQHGHAIGDVAIGHVARLLARDRRLSDILARYGGEEFVLLLPHTPLEGALSLAERLRYLIEQSPYRTGQGEARLTVSIGVAGFDTGMREASDLLESADGALYRSKREGRNRVSTPTPEGDDQA